MIRAGDTFFVAHPSYSHLYVVISDPVQSQSRIVVASITTDKKDEEDCCVLVKGDHPAIQHKSVIRYKDAKELSVKQVEKLVQAKLLSPRQAVTAELLSRIRAGACTSDYLPQGCRSVLENQGLI